MSAKWSLDRDEVTRNWTGTSTTKSGQFSRRRKRTSSTLTLTHSPTKISVKGAVPEGHYSKPEMRKLEDELHEKLFSLLENKVAKHLRMAGR